MNPSKRRNRAKPIIELSRVTVLINLITALRGVSWKVREGESWVVIGPNGSGKTTLLSVINGYRWPTKGRVTVMGEQFGRTDLRDLRRKIGITSYSLESWIPPNETAIDIVVSGKYGSSGLWRRVTSEEEERARSLLVLLGCSNCARRMIREVSQGQKQRIMIARSLMSDPKILTLDEPFEGLDLPVRENFISSLATIAKKRKPTIILVSHRTEEIPPGFTHALLLNKGKEVASGPIREVLTDRLLSKCFETPVKLELWNGRYYTKIVEDNP